MQKQREKNAKKSWQILLATSKRIVMDACLDLQKCIRIILMEKKNSVRLTWSLTPDIQKKISVRKEWVASINKAARKEKTAQLGCVQVAQFRCAYFIKFHKKIFRIYFKKVLPNRAFSYILIHVVT